MKHTFKGFSSAIIAGALLMVLNATTARSQDTTKPTLTFSIKSGQRWSNEVFTVQGTATDKGGSVTNVLYSLNQAGWTNAVTANGWTNWSAELNLLPGTNILDAFAVDASGNRSVTNTVRVVYYLTAVLTVRTNGTGKISITPAYDGAQLQIGANYTITANSSVAGYGALNWTDASNNIITNGGTLKFMMASNLTLTANYGDNVRPLIRITNTHTNGVVNTLVIEGTASDNVAVSNVLYRMNNNSYQPVPTTNHWTNWTATVTMQPGSNTFYIYAVDTSMNISQTTTMRIFNTTTPKTLSGLQATVAPDGGTAFQVAFGAKTFSQVAGKEDTNTVNAVGNYTYTKGADGAYAKLKINYTAPPSAIKKGGQSYDLYFTDSQTAYFAATNIVGTNYTVYFTNNLNVVTSTNIQTNVVVTVSGYAYFSTAPQFAQKSGVNQFLISAGSGVDSGYGTFFQKGIFTSYPLLSSGTNTGKYTYSLYSPISALFKLTNTNSTDYIIATFGSTNYGAFYSEEYTPAGVTNVAMM